jgi:DNA-3-methyladenine glycosylase II
MTERYAAARKHLREADPVLARLIDKHPDFDPRAWMAELPKLDAYGTLLFQIVGQQLSVRATRAILARLEALFGGRIPEPQEILDADPGALRGAGMSRRTSRCRANGRYCR